MIHVTMDHYSHSNGDTEKDLYGKSCKQLLLVYFNVVS